MLGSLALSLLLQAAQVTPVLGFPEPGVDDPGAYQGYQTRFYRDSKRNALQIYLEPRGGRAVHLWADAANESIGFTARDRAGKPARMTWGAEAAGVADSGAARSLEYRLTIHSSQVELGWFLLGSMRVERDFVYAGRQLQPFSAPPFQVAEESLLVAAVSRLPAEVRRDHLALLKAGTLDALRSRLLPSISVVRDGNRWRITVTRPSLDGRNRLALEFRTASGDSVLRPGSRTVAIRAGSGDLVNLSVRLTTDAAPLTPLSRAEIFNREFLAFLAQAGRATDSAGRVRARRLERQVRGVELLSTREKLMAGLPNFATYFGRDMLMTALMMQPVWVPTMAEHVLASVLRKLGGAGSVSHEEALGGQAIRENGQIYDSLVTRYLREGRAEGADAARGTLEKAAQVLGSLQRTRENYHMVDDEYQFLVLMARYLDDPAISADRKRAFLLDRSDRGTPRLERLLREMALVTLMTIPYVNDPRPTKLVGFQKRDSIHWRSSSWRDSDAGYGGGRFAMDVNAIWVPQALEGMATILRTLPKIGVTSAALDSIAPSPAATLRRYVRDSAALRRAIGVWNGARRHFEVKLSAEEAGQRIRAKLAWLPNDERRYWEQVLARSGSVRDSVFFLALALDGEGKPIPVSSTDRATGLFLGNLTATVRAGGLTGEAARREVAPFADPFPLGLYVEGLGPLVANDAYASRDIWERFKKDPYHGPRVVWGREVNLLLLGLAKQIGAGFDRSGSVTDARSLPYLRGLEGLLDRTLAAVHASGLEHNELWSYRIENARLQPTRYGTSSDIQLWNGTNLAVQYVLSQLPRVPR